MKSKTFKTGKPKMTKEVLKKAVAGVLIPAVLMPSCSPYFLDEEDIATINNSITDNPKNSDAVSVAQINLSVEDRKFLEFLENLVADILENPQIAKSFTENPQAIAQRYGVKDLNINFDDELWKLIIALGDEDLHNAIIDEDIQRFFSLCESRGLIAETNKSEMVKYFNELFEGLEPLENASGVCFSAVAVVSIAAAAIGVAVVSAVSYWALDRGNPSAMILRDPQAYQLWILKHGKENTQIILTEYQEKIISDCIDVLYEYFPEKANEMDMDKWRHFMALNML